MTTIDILKRPAPPGELAVLDEAGKNALLLSMADSLLSHEGAILAENEADMSDARGHISDVMLDRLRLTMTDWRAWPTACGPLPPCPTTPAVLSEVRRPNGLVIQKVHVPLGLVSIIYESRPNVTSRCGGSGAKIRQCLRTPQRQGGLPYRPRHRAGAEGRHRDAEGGDPDILNIVDDTTHQSAADIMTAKGLVDLLTPPGRRGTDPKPAWPAPPCPASRRAPVSAMYVDESADLSKA